MRWLLVILLTCASTAAQVNLKLTSPLLPLSWSQAIELGLGQALVLLLRAGGLSGLALVITWYAYKYFGFLELWVVTATTYIAAAAVAYFVFEEPLTWLRVGGLAMVACGVGLFFAK